jgi:hypothetical protein
MESFDDLANDIEAIETRISDAIFDAVREQLHTDAGPAKELERQLSKVRRSLQKAQFVLRGLD